MELRLPLGCAHEPQVAQRFVRVRLRDAHTLSLAVEPVMAPDVNSDAAPASVTECFSSADAAHDAVCEGSPDAALAPLPLLTGQASVTPTDSSDEGTDAGLAEAQVLSPDSTDASASAITVVPAHSEAVTVHYATLVHLPRPIYNMAVMECHVQPTAVVKKTFFARRKLPRPEDAASDESEWEDVEDEDPGAAAAASVAAAIARRDARVEAAAAAAAFARPAMPSRPFSPVVCAVPLEAPDSLASDQAAAPSSPSSPSASAASSSSSTSSSLSREPSVITLALSMPAASPRDLAHDWVMGEPPQQQPNPTPPPTPTAPARAPGPCEPLMQMDRAACGLLLSRFKGVVQCTGMREGKRAKKTRKAFDSSQKCSSY